MVFSYSLGFKRLRGRWIPKRYDFSMHFERLQKKFLSGINALEDVSKYLSHKFLIFEDTIDDIEIKVYDCYRVWIMFKSGDYYLRVSEVAADLIYPRDGGFDSNFAKNFIEKCAEICENIEQHFLISLI